MLTVDLSGISDPDGARGRGLQLPVDTPRRAATETDLAEQDGPHLRGPVGDDAGNSLGVRVSFVDGGGYQEGPLVSEAVAVAGAVTLVLSPDSIAEDGGAATVTAAVEPGLGRRRSR